MSARAASSERMTLERLLDALSQVHSVDSELYIEVTQEIFDSFDGPVRRIEDDEGGEPFYSRRVLEIPGDHGPGTSVTVDLWTSPTRAAAPRRLTVV